MVTSATSFGRSGLYDWIIQRATAVILGAYFLVLMGFFLLNPDLNYVEWKAFMAYMPMRIFSILTLLSIMAHAWIGLWTVSTDYIKPAGLRFLFQAVCFIVIFAYMVWGLYSLWGA